MLPLRAIYVDMKKYWLISIWIFMLGWCFSLSAYAEAEAYAEPDRYTQPIRRAPKGAVSNGVRATSRRTSSSFSVRKKPQTSPIRRSAGSGLSHKGTYSTRDHAIEQGFTLSLEGFYYYGDLEPKGVGVRPENFAGGGNIAYYVSAAKGVNCRFSLGVGYLQGDISRKGSAKQEFSNIFGEFDTGVEWYPWKDYGFYLFGGLGVIMGNINYVYDGNAEFVSTWLPVVPLEIGYSFDLSSNWKMAVKAAGHVGLIDKPRSNLDGYPNKFVSDPTKYTTPDGYISLGVSFTYHWAR